MLAGTPGQGWGLRFRSPPAQPAPAPPAPTYDGAVGPHRHQEGGGHCEGGEDAGVVREEEVAQVVVAPPHQHVQHEEGGGGQAARQEEGEEGQAGELLVHGWAGQGDTLGLNVRLLVAGFLPEHVSQNEEDCPYGTSKCTVHIVTVLNRGLTK